MFWGACSRGVPGCSRDVPGVFRGCSGGVLGVLWGCSGGVPGVFWVCWGRSGGVLVAFWGVVGGCLGVVGGSLGPPKHSGSRTGWSFDPRAHWRPEACTPIRPAKHCDISSSPRRSLAPTLRPPLSTSLFCGLVCVRVVLVCCGRFVFDLCSLVRKPPVGPRAPAAGLLATRCIRILNRNRLLDNPLKITKKTKKTDKRDPFKGPGLLPSGVPLRT